jgi:hypothetical protein
MNWKYVASALLGGGIVYLALAVRAPLPREVSQLERLMTDPVPPALAETSGTGLKAKYVTGADGSQLFDPEVLYDTQLQADCRFHLASDDTVRCLPITDFDSTEGGPRIHYLDAACTQGIVWLDGAPSGCVITPPKHVSTYGTAPYCGVASGEALPIHVFTVGQLVGVPTGSVYERSGSGQCRVAGFVASNWVAYAIDGELPPSAFVAGTAGSGS